MNVSNGTSKHQSTVTATQIPSLFQQQQALKPIAVSPGGPPWNETVVVTPDLAEQWLKSNILNRKARKTRVRMYARDMAAGRWLFNTQGISFATDGSLIDGQHRLMAVVESGVSVTFVVWFNVPPASRSVIDLNGPRNLADIARLTCIQSAVTQAMMRGQSGRGSIETMAEREAFYKRFAPQIDGTIARFPTHIRGVTQANVLAVIARASLYLDDGDITQFCEVLRTGMHSDNPRDATVIRLRDRLMQASHPGGSTAAREVYSYSAGALRAFASGRSLSKLYQTSVDPFPLPKPTDE